MADVTPFRPAPKEPTDEERRAELAKEAHRRFKRAERDRNIHLPAIEGIYELAIPWRHQANAEQVVDRMDEIYDSMMMGVVEDFSADMGLTFTPQSTAWLEVVATQELAPDHKTMVKEAITEYRDFIFDKMRQSNLYQALQEAYRDLSPGTMCLTVNDIGINEPIHCEAVVCTDLYLERRAFGRVNPFRKFRLTLDQYEEMWPDARKPTNPADTSKGEAVFDVIDGCWRTSTPEQPEAYKYVVMVGNDIMWERNYEGAGSCPFIVARWSTDAQTAWGVGPGRQVLSDMRTLNQIRYLGIEQMDFVVNPSVSYVADGMVTSDLKRGPGDWVPRAMGSEAPQPIESKARWDVAWLEIQNLRSAVRRAHYQDEPMQTGKTPPTATQWADEAMRKQRRMGTPATNLVQELLYPLFKRYAYLLEKRGVLPKVELNGEALGLEPVSPLLKAQEKSEVVEVDTWAAGAKMIVGEQTFQAYFKGEEYLRFSAEKSHGKTKLIRSEAEAIEYMATVAKAGAEMMGGGGAPEGGP